MKKGLCLLLFTVSLSACNDNSTTVSVKTDSASRELDKLGEKIEEKAAVAGDSVKAKFNDIRESLKERIDSVKKGRNHTTD